MPNLDSSTQICRRSTDPLGDFTSVRTTSYAHKTIRIAASSGKSQNFFSILSL